MIRSIRSNQIAPNIPIRHHSISVFCGNNDFCCWQAALDADPGFSRPRRAANDDDGSAFPSHHTRGGVGFCVFQVGTGGS